jgi:protein TonB
MFEGTLVESRGLERTGTARWSALGSVTLQVGLAGLLIAIPMWRPEALPMLSLAPRVMLPRLSKPPAVETEPRTDAGSSGVSLPATSAAQPVEVGGPLTFAPRGQTDGPAPGLVTEIGMGTGPGPLAILGPSGSGTGVSVERAHPAARMRVSSGVLAGMLLTPIRPVYPVIAKAAGVQGAVVLEAVISKAGRIESLRAVSGPAMLRSAAMEAVQAARYVPYLLNGEPVEVQTTIMVVFQLGS